MDICDNPRTLAGMQPAGEGLFVYSRHNTGDIQWLYYLVFGKNSPSVYQEALLMGMSRDSAILSRQLAHYYILESTNREKERYLSFFYHSKDNVELIRRNFGATYWFYHFYARLW